jgi:hypothetical protein
MDNTKRETFRRLLDSRLPKATKAVKLLGNLSRKGQYEYTHLEAQQLIKELQAEVTTLADKFKVTTTAPEPTTTAPTKPTEGRLDMNDRGDVAWAYEMLLRGKTDDAKKMLHRVVGNFINDLKKGK